MALNKSEGASTVFLSVADGNLVRSYKVANDNTIERVTKTGKLVFEEKYKDLTGIITSIETKENDFGKQWAVTFMDGSDKYVVNMPFSSRYAASFLKALPNIDGNKVVKFMPWSMTDKQDASKKITGITMYQNDGNGFVKILPAFTKEAPNGLPQMKKIKVKGKETWDDSDMMEFLENVAKEFIAGLKKSAPEAIENESEEAPF
jgi:hypothetical protein